MTGQNHTHPSMAPIFDMLVAPVKLAILEAALDLDIAAVLTRQMDTKTAAKALGLKEEIQAAPDGLGHLLDAMAGLGFLDKKNGRYKNTAFSDAYLNTKSPLYMKPFITRMKTMQHKHLNRIAHIVRTGPPALEKQESLETESRWETAAADLAVYQQAGIARTAADIAGGLPEFDNAKKLLDLGGGPGLIGAHIVKSHPAMTGVLLDLPAIINQAKKHISRFGMAERFSFIPGDYNQVDLGGGYDIVWASHNLYYVKGKTAFFKRLKNAMNPGGVFLCLHEGLTCERTQPWSIILSRLSFALEGQDVSFNEGQLAGHIRQAGFDPVETSHLDLGVGRCELVIARKGLKS